MAVDREALFVALFDRLKAQLGTTMKSYTRRPETWDDTMAVEQPALLLVKGNEKRRMRERGQPLIWDLRADIWIYMKDDNTNEAIPSTQINQILTLIETAMEVQRDEATAAGAQFLARRDQPPAGTTLGGLCLSCEIVDDVQVYEGVQGHTAYLIIPVEITAAA